MQDTPKIFEYLSPLTYLEDTYRFRKRKDPSFSFEKWSDELGFKSRSFLKMIILGERKITPRFIEAYSQVYRLESEEKDFFSIIAQYHQSENAASKDLFLQKIFEARGGRRDLTMIENETEFLSSPLIPVIQTLLTFKDIEKTPDIMANILGESVDKISACMENLKKMGIVENEKSFRVGIKFGSEALKNYHNHSLLEAIKAQDLPVEQRRYRSMILPLNEQEYAELLESIKAFAARTLAKYEADELQDRQLYKLNLNIFPISKKR